MANMLFNCDFCAHSPTQYDYGQMQSHLAEDHKVGRYETFLFVLTIVKFSKDEIIDKLMKQIRERAEVLVASIEEQFEDTDDIDEPEEVETSIEDDSSEETLNELTEEQNSLIDEPENSSMEESFEVSEESSIETCIDDSSIATDEDISRMQERIEEEVESDDDDDDEINKIVQEAAINTVEVKTETIEEIEMKPNPVTKSQGLNLVEKFANMPREICRLCYEGFDKVSKEDHELNEHLDDKEALQMEFFTLEDLTYNCSICPAKYLTQNLVNKHESTVHRMARNVKCKLCLKTLPPNALSNHMMVHKKGINCKLCYKNFNNEENRQAHMVTVHKDDEFLTKEISDSDLTVSCDKCNFKFVSDVVLRIHKDTEHDQINAKDFYDIKSKTYTCKLCHEKFKEGYKIIKHVNAFHAKDKHLLQRPLHKSEFIVQCDKCDLMFLTESLVDFHRLRTHFAKARKVPCSLCDKMISRYNYSIHKSKHANENRNTKSSLKHTTTTATCHICFNTISNKYNMKSHLRNHKEVKEWWYKEVPEHMLKHQCKYCDAKLMSKGVFSFHMNKHIAQKFEFLRKTSFDSSTNKYKCKLCMKHYGAFENLRNHFMSVHEENDMELLKRELTPQDFIFACSQSNCEMTFPSSASLDYHLKNSHEIKIKKINIKVKAESRERYCQLCGIFYKKPHFFQVHKKKVHGNELDAFDKDISVNDLNHPCTVSKCSRRFYSGNALNFHMISKHNSGTVTYCKICDYNFEESRKFNSHKYRVHKKELDLFKRDLTDEDFKEPCPECENVFASKSSLIFHIRTKHSGETGTKLRKLILTEKHCKLCNITYKKPQFLESHKRKVHANELDAFNKDISVNDLNHPCTVSKCNRRFYSENALNFHMNNKHYRGTVTYCKICKHEFQSPMKFMNHKYQVHKKELDLFKKDLDEGNFKEYCPECEISFASKAALIFHITRKHSQAQGTNIKTKVLTEKYCKLCNITYKKAFFLLAHKKKIHSQELHLFDKDLTSIDLKYPCKNCGTKFYTQATLDYHMHTKHYKGHTKTHCELCDYDFPQPVAFAAHKHKIHRHEYALFKKTLVPSEFMFACNHCDKKFPSKPSLDFHEMKLHKNLKFKKIVLAGKKEIKNHECRLCYTNFGFASNLSKHLETNHKEDLHFLKNEITEELLSFPCDNCHLAFVSDNVLGYHKRKVHKDNTSVCKLCAINFPNAFKFELHRKKVHKSKEEQEAFSKDLDPSSLTETCKYCKEKFLNTHVLKSHSMYNHKEEKKQDEKCEYCNKVFPYDPNRKTKIVNHMRVLHNINNYNVDAMNTTVPASNMTVENFMNFFNSLTQ